MGGNYHSFVMIKLRKENVDAMIEKAQQNQGNPMPQKQFSQNS